MWCESLPAPATCGLGATAAEAMALYTQLRTLMHSCACIQQCHAAISESQPPLQVCVWGGRGWGLHIGAAFFSYGHRRLAI